MTQRIAMVEIGPGLGTAEEVTEIWNRDNGLAATGRAVTPGSAGRAFPLDPVSLAAGFAISVAAGVTTEALVAGLRSLFERRAPKARLEIVVESDAQEIVRIRIESVGHGQAHITQTDRS